MSLFNIFIPFRIVFLHSSFFYKEYNFDSRWYSRVRRTRKYLYSKDTKTIQCHFKALTMLSVLPLNIEPVKRCEFIAFQLLTEEFSPHIRTPKLRCRILLVDDESDIAFIYEQILEDEGFEVNSLNDLPNGLSNFRVDTYDIALIDIKMPRMNGLICIEN